MRRCLVYQDRKMRNPDKHNFSSCFGNESLKFLKQPNASVAEELASQSEQLQSTTDFFTTNGTGRKSGKSKTVSKTLKKVAHLKTQQHEEETDSPDESEKPDGYAMKMKPKARPDDLLDNDFERF